MTIPFVRTPDHRFGDLAGFPYEPKYVEVEGLRMAYVEEGTGEGPERSCCCTANRRGGISTDA